MSEVREYIPQEVRRMRAENGRVNDETSSFLDARWDSLGESQLRKWIRSHKDVALKHYGKKTVDWYVAATQIGQTSRSAEVRRLPTSTRRGILSATWRTQRSACTLEHHPKDYLRGYFGGTYAPYYRIEGSFLLESCRMRTKVSAGRALVVVSCY